MTTPKGKPGHDVITGSKGPVDLGGKDPLESKPGDTITGSRGPVETGPTAVAPPPPAGAAPSDGGETLDEVAARNAKDNPPEPDASLGNAPVEGEPKEGERVWADVHTRVLTMAGVNGASLHGSLTYSEDGDLDDEGVEELEEDMVDAGAEAGIGRRVGKALQSMGYGAEFKAAPPPAEES